MSVKYDFKSLAEELHKPFLRPRITRHVFVKDVNDVWTMDLVDMNDRKIHNHNVRYILVVMDVKSRYAWALPQEKKDAESTMSNIEFIMDEMGVKPKYIWADQGKEFYNKKLGELLKKEGIKLYSTFGDHKAAMIERFNRTLKTWMYKEFTANNDNDWLSILDELIEKYNDKKHSSIGISPKMAYKHPNKIREKVRFVKSKNNKFKVGDLVRIAVVKGTFEKGYTPNWSIELFKVNKVLPTTPVTYKLKDLEGEEIEGSFYENELMKTQFTEPLYLVNEVLDRKTEKGKKKVLVSWLGYRKDANSWIDESELKDV